MNPAPLLDRLQNYPVASGWKAEGTSREAAQKIDASGRSEVLRQRVLFCLKKAMTPKEVADVLGEEITSVRPRITQLKAKGLVEETGERSKGQNIYIAIA